MLKAANTGAQNVTDFADGVNGQRITVTGDGFTTANNGATIVCKSGADTLLATNVVYEFVRYHNAWYQI